MKTIIIILLISLIPLGLRAFDVIDWTWIAVIIIPVLVGLLELFFVLFIKGMME